MRSIIFGCGVEYLDFLNFGPMNVTFVAMIGSSRRYLDIAPVPCQAFAANFRMAGEGCKEFGPRRLSAGPGYGSLSTLREMTPAEASNMSPSRDGLRWSMEENKHAHDDCRMRMDQGCVKN